MSKCVKCGFPKYNNSLGIIWLSEDGYCSVCNNHFKDRKKLIGGMDRFVKTTLIKEGKNLHLTTWGTKVTDYTKLRYKIKMNEKQGVANQMVKEVLEKRKRKIEEFL